MKHVKALFLVFLSLLGTCAMAQSSEEGGVFAGNPEPIKIAALYPNPAVEFLHVSFEEPVAREAKFTVHNIIGNVLDVETETLDEYEVRIKVKDLPVGYYIVAIRDERTNRRNNLKFLKR